MITVKEYNLSKPDFSKLSNGQLLAVAEKFKKLFNLYSAGQRFDEPCIITYNGDDRPGKSFARMDMKDPDFVEAIEDYAIGSVRSIWQEAGRRSITTAVKQILGTGPLELADLGYLPVEGRSAPKAMPGTPVRTNEARAYTYIAYNGQHIMLGPRGVGH